jgi:hypothetical protein
MAADVLGRIARAARILNSEQRVAAAGSLLLMLSTLGSFSFVEGAQLVLALGVLALLFGRAEGARFHLPFGDGTVIAGAGVWAGALIFAGLLDRGVGQNIVGAAAAAILFLADDVPADAPDGPAPIRPRRPPRRPGAAARVDATTDPLPPPEFKPYSPAEGEQLHLGPEDPEDGQA